MTGPVESIQVEDEIAGGGTISLTYRLIQFFVLVASVISIMLYWWAAKSLGIPAERGFDASVLQQPHWPLVMISIYIVFFVCLIVGTLVSGRWWFFGGLFAAVVGMGVLSARGGPIRYVLFDAQATGSPQHVFISLAVETCLLFIPIGLAWSYLWRRFELYGPPRKPMTAASAEMPLGVAILAQAGIMAVIILLLAATDSKKQVLVSVFLGGLIGSWLADHSFPHQRAARWYWLGPLAVGVIGYLLAYFNAATATSGAPTGALAALARPLPLDYASAGVAGTLLGYWLGAERPRVQFSWMVWRNRKDPTVIAPEAAANPLSN